MALRTRTPGARALLPATRCQSSGPLGALLSSPALGVRLLTALQVLQDPTEANQNSFVLVPPASRLFTRLQP